MKKLRLILATLAIAAFVAVGHSDARPTVQPEKAQDCCATGSCDGGSCDGGSCGCGSCCH